MGQATCRVTPALDEMIDDAAEEAGLFRSDIFRRALVYYIEQNPDRLHAITERDLSGLGQTAETGENAGNSVQTEDMVGFTGGTYDPLKDQ